MTEKITSTHDGEAMEPSQDEQIRALAGVPDATAEDWRNYRWSSRYDCGALYKADVNGISVEVNLDSRLLGVASPVGGINAEKAERIALAYRVAADALRAATEDGSDLEAAEGQELLDVLALGGES